MQVQQRMGAQVATPLRSMLPGGAQGEGSSGLRVRCTANSASVPEPAAHTCTCWALRCRPQSYAQAGRHQRHSLGDVLRQPVGVQLDVDEAGACSSVVGGQGGGGCSTNRWS